MTNIMLGEQSRIDCKIPLPKDAIQTYIFSVVLDAEE